MIKNRKKWLLSLLAVGILTTSVAGASIGSAKTQNPLAIRYEEKQSAAFLGETAELAIVSPVYPDQVDYVYYSVVDPSGKTVKHDGSGFAVSELGAYTVRVCVVGVNGETFVDEYTVSATKSEAPVISQKPKLPTAYLEGFTYPVPAAVFTDYSAQTPTETAYTVTLVDEFGNEKALGAEFSPETTLHGEEITLKYAATSSVTGKTCEVELPVPVLEASKTDEYGTPFYAYDKTFVTTGVQESAVTDAGACFYGSQDFTLAFANDLEASVVVALKSAAGRVNFGSATITVSDAYTPSERFEIEIVNGAPTQSTVRVNGEGSFTTESSLFDFNKGVSFSFNNKTLQLEDTNGKKLTKIVRTADGREFSGFSSGFVRVEIEAKNVSALSALAVESLNGHGMSAGNEYDMILPFAVPAASFTVKNRVGDKVTVPAAVAYDVIDPCVSTRVSVFDEEGNTVVAEDGTEMYEAPANRSYEIVLKTAGEYTLQYIAEDASENLYDFAYYSLFALDGVAPTISVSKIASSVKVGESLTLPKPSVSDDATAKDSLVVWVTVYRPDDGYDYVEAGKKYKFTQKGTYYIRYTVMDGNNNTTTVERKVVCK